MHVIDQWTGFGTGLRQGANRVAGLNRVAFLDLNVLRCLAI